MSEVRITVVYGETRIDIEKHGVDEASLISPVAPPIELLDLAVEAVKKALS